MKKPIRFLFPLTVMLLGSLALSACSGALNGQGINFNDLTPGSIPVTLPAHPTEAPEIHTTGTPEVQGQGTGEPTDVPDTQEAATEAPATEQPRACKTPQAAATAGADNSHEVVGIVTAWANNVITINGVNYTVVDTTVTHGTIQVGDTVRLTFRFDASCTPVVNEVKAVDANGSSDGQGNGNGNSQEGGAHERGTPEPGPGNSGGG